MARRVAGMHEARDRAILTVQRLSEAEGAVFQHTGFNPRKVRNAQGLGSGAHRSLENECICTRDSVRVHGNTRSSLDSIP